MVWCCVDLKSIESRTDEQENTLDKNKTHKKTKTNEIMLYYSNVGEIKNYIFKLWVYDKF